MALSVCSITANVYYVDGTIGGTDIYLETKDVVLSDEVLAEFSKTFTASNGVLTLTLPQGATAKLRGTVQGFSDWVTIAIPASATADLVDLITVAQVPTTGIVVQDDGVAHTDKVGTFNFTDGISATQTSAGVSEVKLPYKAYRALLTQTGTAAPVATVLENSLGGTVVWTYAASGRYDATLVGAFLAGKVTYNSGFVNDLSAPTGIFSIMRSDNNTLRLVTTSAGDVATVADDILLATFIEVLVYP